MISPAQCRAARGLLRWTQEHLASNSGVSIVTIRNFEAEKTTNPQKSTLRLLKIAFDNAGVEFIDDGRPGVRMKGA